MYRKFIATVAAASIALTALGAFPVAAGERDTAKVIAAILGLAVVGKIIHDRNERKEEARHDSKRPIYRTPEYKKPVHRVPEYKKPVHQPPRYTQPRPRPLPDRVNRKLLPQQCLRSFETRQGRVRMFANQCLKRNYKFAHRLPQQCSYVFSTPRGDRRGYEARCLRDRGFRLARG
ncbi:hypothetical protein OS190_00570 [Sulfitobacter sp. F26204]|uniref:hypothetical protein n=1 Tax=Sulfitobacter sp. F26204 TaxID=2996014 RepID=UPI00225E2726|nr:hypothetical protein [Sulfitobacter sp. F26204]MCX7558040.1 hypothetical protein [Sulfitobacter sp. F26204]